MATYSDNSKKSFEIVVLGTGGGPLETDVSGYMLKPACGRYEDGWIAVEGGSGIGALSNIIERSQNSLSLSSSSSTINQPFPDLSFPLEYESFSSTVRSVYKAGYLYSYLSCYILTHAHLDHVASLILSTGSLPTTRLSSSPLASTPSPFKRERRRSSGVSFPGLHLSSRSHSVEQSPLSPSGAGAAELGPAFYNPGFSSERRRSLALATSESRDTLIQIYASGAVLKDIEGVFEGKIWPELGWWSDDMSDERMTSDGRVKESFQTMQGVGVQYCPLPKDQMYQRLPLVSELGISCMHLPVSHGCNSQGVYESSAFFLRLDGNKDERGLEILFWGDVESSLRPDGLKGGCRFVGGAETSRVDEMGPEGEDLNGKVWKVAARRWIDGKLGAVFIECSYDSSRPFDVLYGHLQPQTLYAELQVLGSLVRKFVSAGDDNDRKQPLHGLKIYITHVKTSLVPHPSGKTNRERVFEELKELESGAGGGGLGVEFVMLENGMRVLV